MPSVTNKKECFRELSPSVTFIGIGSVYVNSAGIKKIGTRTIWAPRHSAERHSAYQHSLGINESYQDTLAMLIKTLHLMTLLILCDITCMFYFFTVLSKVIHK
jgi:hypothetical protein